MKGATFYIIAGLLFLYLPFFSPAQPIAGFTVNYSSPACNPAIVNFTNTSTGQGPLSYLWQPGIDNSTDTATNISFTYDSCGTYTVILTVTDTTGQTDADTQLVVIHCAPNVNFSFDSALICISSNVQFTDLSTPHDSVISWLWNFGDASSGIENSSSLENPQHFYDSAGMFVVSLQVTTPNGCTAAQTDSLQVFIPVASFTANDTSVCTNDTVSFSNISFSQDPITAYAWSFGDTSSNDNTSSLQNPVHVYTQPGEYTVTLTITTEHNCTSSYVKTIVVNGAPNVDAGVDQQICPLDSAHLLATGASNYEWTPSNFLTNNAIADPIAFPSTTTTFHVTGTDNEGCKASDSITVIVLPFPIISAGGDITICQGSSGALHGSGGVFYLWLPNVNISNDTSANPTVFPSTTTTYTVLVVDTNGCSGRDSATVFVVPSVTSTINGLADQYCHNNPPITLSATPEGGLFSGDGVSGNLFDPSLLAPGGPYSIIYSFPDSISCGSSDTAVVMILSPPDVSISVTDSTVCLNGTPVEFELNPLGGILSGTGIVGNSFYPSIAGTGTFEISYSLTDTSGCIGVDSVAITVLPLPLISAGSDTGICIGDSVQLQASGGTSYVWLPDSSLSNSQIADPIAFPPITTQYILLGTDASGCANLDYVIVNVFNPADADAGPDVTICSGDSVMLNATGGTEFSWFPLIGLSDSNIANPYAFPDSTTLYKVLVSTGNNCPGSDSVLVTVHPLPVVVASGDSAFCEGISQQLHAAGAINYEWLPATFLDNNQSADPVSNPDTTITYVVKGTDSFGCSGFDSVTLLVFPLPEIDAGNDSAICEGDSLQLHVTGGSNYAWLPSVSLTGDTIADPVAFPASTTTYTVTGNNNFGCLNSDSITLFVISSSTVDAGNDTSICMGDSVVLNASPGTDYSWSPAAGLSNAFVQNPTAFPGSTTTYTVTVSVGSNCSFSDSVKITVHPLPVVDAGTGTTICGGDSAQLHASGAVTFIWTPSASVDNDQSADPFAFPDSTTIYAVTGFDNNGCKNSDTVTVVVLSTPIIDSGSDTSICIGDTIILHGTGGDTYSWTPASSLGDYQSATPLAFPSITTSYVLQGINSSGCSGYDTVTIVVNPLPDADAGEDQVVCAGSTIQLNASGGNEYSWTPATGLSNSSVQNPFALVTATITYSVTVTDINHCSATDSIHLSVAPLLNASAGNDTTICHGFAALLHAGGGSLYEWSPTQSISDPSSPEPIATPDSTTTYSVIISDGICYSDTLPVTVNVSAPFVNAGPDAMLTSGEGYTFNITGSPGVYQWTPQEGLSCSTCMNPVATPGQTTTYTVTVTDTSGCIASDDIVITAGCGDDMVFIPNAFTPNGNHQNDVLYVRSYGISSLKYFRIFDRWGHLLFESNDVNNGWDGSHNGRPMSPGVYLYALEAECGNGTIVKKQGNITLLK